MVLSSQRCMYDAQLLVRTSSFPIPSHLGLKCAKTELARDIISIITRVIKTPTTAPLASPKEMLTMAETYSRLCLEREYSSCLGKILLGQL